MKGEALQPPPRGLLLLEGRALLEFAATLSVYPFLCRTERGDGHPVIEGPLSQNIEVASSHLGIGHHPVALLAIADRLAQPEGAWKRFIPHVGWRWPFVPRTVQLEVEPAVS